ncbi:MAG: hypothetical protein A2038_15535 [Deltaproteobacteria bacterium GWA2_57_13]|nr:MAG: hypothetical protein A2038_15535 [Deltaproteobacteria bacterium GWA2_57_13]
MPTNKLNLTRRRLLRWYGQNRRALPWRRTRDPYAIWVAETMLQQTQVKTVLPYYSRFLKAFPKLKDLAQTRRQKVLALWSGLGYYRRAENFIRAARLILKEHGGNIPRDYRRLRNLPGVGPYTAGALMSIAFGQPYPALDGNARRVLGRALNVRKERNLQKIAQELVSGPRPGHLNQALMELGATVCQSRDPNCPRCPLAPSCAARSSGELRLHGAPRRKSQPVYVDWPLALIQSDGRLLIRRRPKGGILGGLWELPGGESKKGEGPKSALKRHLDELNGQVNFISRVGEIRHSITYRRIRAPVYCLVAKKKRRLPSSHWRWVSISALPRYPLSSLTLKAVRLFGRP